MKRKSLKLLARAFMLLCVALPLCKNASAAYVIACSDTQPAVNAITIFVDCSSRRDVLRGVGMGWKLMRDQGIRGSVEDLCYEPFDRLQRLHPAIPITGIAQSFIAQCNAGLRYLE